MLLLCSKCMEPVTPMLGVSGIFVCDTEPNPLGRLALVAGLLRRVVPPWHASGDTRITEADARGFIRYAEHTDTCTKVLRPSIPPEKIKTRPNPVLDDLQDTRPGFNRGER